MKNSFLPQAFHALHTPQAAASCVLDGVRRITSPVFEAEFPFSSLVLCLLPDGKITGGTTLCAQVEVDGVWSKFYHLGRWEGSSQASFPAQSDGQGRVDIDQLQLCRPARAYRFLLTLPAQSKIPQVAASALRAPFVYRAETSACLPGGQFEAMVEPVSQFALGGADARRICSPSCLCMALNALGLKTSLEETLPGVFDAAAQIYGNWIFNTAYASMRGARAHVRRFSALAELAEFCTPDSFVIASIAFGPGELPGAPLTQTPGHLVLVRGWKDGQVLVADPAAPSAGSVLRSYDAAAFARAWLQHKQGAAYLVRKK